MKLSFAFALLLVVSCAGVSFAQSKKQLQVEIPPVWTAAKGLTSETAQLKEWWRNFRDPQLETLVSQALATNADLRIAAARVREVRALRGAAKTARYPTVDQTGVVAGHRTILQMPDSSLAVEHGLFQAGFDANWELDFFGGVSNSVKAATAEVAVAEESQRDVMVTVVAEVARNYIALRGFQRQLAVTRSNIDTQRDTRDLTAVRARAGLATDLDVARAEAQLASTEAVVPELEALITNTSNRLDVLLGRTNGVLLAELEKTQPIPAASFETPIGLPSELLRRRPDIRRAEAAILVESAKLGIARSEMYPKLELSGLLGRTASSTGGLTLGLGNFFFGGVGVRLPIFNSGRIRSNIRAQDARLDQAILQYEDTVRQAFAEVETSLTSYEREREQRAKLQQAFTSNGRAVELAQELYRAGLSDFLSVLEAEEELYQSEHELAKSEARVSTNLVALYKALGGGW